MKTGQTVAIPQHLMAKQRHTMLFRRQNTKKQSMCRAE